MVATIAPRPALVPTATPNRMRPFTAPRQTDVGNGREVVAAAAEWGQALLAARTGHADMGWRCRMGLRHEVACCLPLARVMLIGWWLATDLTRIHQQHNREPAIARDID